MCKETAVQLRTRCERGSLIRNIVLYARLADGRARYTIHRAGENIFDIRQFLMARLPFEITEFAIEAQAILAK